MQFCLQAVTGLGRYSYVRVWMPRVFGENPGEANSNQVDQ